MSASPNPPILNAPAAVRWLVGATVVVHLVRVMMPAGLENALLEVLAFVPTRYQAPDAWATHWPVLLSSPITHLLLHADLMHLILNMAFLLAFGTVVARRMGALWFLGLYILCGVLAAFFWAWLYSAGVAFLLGASGAISGMVGATARVSIWPPRIAGTALPFWRRSTVVTFVVTWLALNIAFGVFPILIGDDVGGIAWQAHLGGFIAGFLLIGLFDGRGRRETVARLHEIL